MDNSAEYDPNKKSPDTVMRQIEVLRVLNVHDSGISLRQIVDNVKSRPSYMGRNLDSVVDSALHILEKQNLAERIHYGIYTITPLGKICLNNANALIDALKDGTLPRVI